MIQLRSNRKVTKKCCILISHTHTPIHTHSRSGGLLKLAIDFCGFQQKCCTNCGYFLCLQSLCEFSDSRYECHAHFNTITRQMHCPLVVSTGVAIVAAVVVVIVDCLFCIKRFVLLTKVLILWPTAVF